MDKISEQLRQIARKYISQLDRWFPRYQAERIRPSDVVSYAYMELISPDLLDMAVKRGLNKMKRDMAAADEQRGKEHPDDIVSNVRARQLAPTPLENYCNENYEIWMENFNK